MSTGRGTGDPRQFVSSHTTCTTGILEHSLEEQNGGRENATTIIRSQSAVLELVGEEFPVHMVTRVSSN